MSHILVSGPMACKMIWSFYSKHYRKLVILLGATLISGIAPTIDSLLLKEILDKVALTDGKGSFIWLALIYAAWWELLNIVYRIYDIVYSKFIPQMKGEAVDILYNQVQHYNHDFFQRNPQGKIASAIMECSRSLEMIFCLFTEKLTRSVILIIASYITIIFINQTLATIYLLWLVAFLSINVLIVNRMGQYARKFSLKKATLSGQIVDTLTNIVNVRMANNYKGEKEYVGNFTAESVEADKQMRWSLILPYYLLGMSCNFLIFFVIYFLGKLYGEDKVTLGDFALIVSLCTTVSTELWLVAQDIGDLFEEFNNFRQSISIVQHESNTIDNSKNLVIKDAQIEFQNVNFRYKGNQELFFSQKNFKVLGKQKVGLVGFSGSGKTTLVNLICRLYEIDSGKILIDDQDITQVSLKSLRDAISIIPQDPTLFNNRSIKDNIAYGVLNASDEAIYDAAKKAYLHDFIMTLPNQYNTICLANSSNLSGGQKQRIAIARALLKDAPILILDEATSSLDSKSEAMVQEALVRLMKGRTTIIIAHR